MLQQVPLRQQQEQQQPVPLVQPQRVPPPWVLPLLEALPSVRRGREQAFAHGRPVQSPMREIRLP